MNEPAEQHSSLTTDAALKPPRLGGIIWLRDLAKYDSINFQIIDYQLVPYRF